MDSPPTCGNWATIRQPRTLWPARRTTPPRPEVSGLTHVTGSACRCRRRPARLRHAGDGPGLHARHARDAPAPLRRTKELWNDTVVQRYAVSTHSAVHLLDRTLAACKSASSRDLATRRASRLHADGLEPHLTCGAPLRNRTVDLLLTTDIRGHSDQA